MFDFINSIRTKSRHSEATFVCMLDTENAVFTNLLLKSVYDLKKHTRKLNANGDFVNCKTDKKTIILRDNYVSACSVFMSRFNYVHMLFTIFLTVLITKKFDFQLHNFGALIKEPEFFNIFDSQEQLILKKFNQLRNILVHTPYIELFIEFSDDEFIGLQNLSVSLIEFEKDIMFHLRRNSFFSPHSHSDGDNDV